jgi:uncharacterized protein YbjT (DUF2867 family)
MPAKPQQPYGRRLIIALFSIGFGAASLATQVVAAAAAATDAAPQPAAREVLVLGGTGQLGAEIIRQLAASGSQRITVFAREGSDRSRLEGLPVTYLIGDLTREADIAAALRSRRFDVIVNAVRVEDGDIHFYEKILTPLARLARETGVGQIIHHGAVGAGANAAKFTSLGWERVPGLLDRLKDQGIGEQQLRDSGVAYTIIRNARIYPDGAPSTGKAELTEDDSVLTPMTRADLALFTVRCLGNADCHNKTYHVRDASLAWPPPKAAH